MAADDPLDLGSSYLDSPHRYRIDGSTSGTDTDIILPQEIIEGSEVVKIDGTYFIFGSHLTGSPRDPAGRFFVFAICNPKNMEKLDKPI